MAEPEAGHALLPRAEMTARPRDRLARQRIYLIATPPAGTRTPSDADGPGWLDRVARIARAGVHLIQLRQKGGDTSSRRAWLRSLRQQLPPTVLLIVNDDLQALTDSDGRRLADGVHIGRGDARDLGEGDLVRGLRRARAQVGPDTLLGSSTRTLAEVRVAVLGGVDHVGFGAMADSPTKSGTTRAQPADLRACTEAFPELPIYPIGGLHMENLQLASVVDLRRAALGSALLDANDPEAVARAAIAWSLES